MTGIALHTGNRLEALGEALSETLRTPLSSPLKEEIVLVQSSGMQRWVSLLLARRNGICANVRFPFPNAFIDELFQNLTPGVISPSPFEPWIMTWRILDALPDCLGRSGFEILRDYLGEAVAGLKGFQLAERIADLFDQYLLFRPEMIFRWESGEDEGWQAALWRELVRKSGSIHRAAIGRMFLESAAVPKERLPERISVFGISALPRFHLQVLAALSRSVGIHLFLLNPCREYWGDLLSGREIRRARTPTSESSPNTLLASMGTRGRDFFDLVYEMESSAPAGFEIFSHFDEPDESSLLGALQSDILTLRERKGPDGSKWTVSESDDSVQVHICHSPMREIEVLRDRLLDMFDADPGLGPGDVLVMAPDIETYAPYIHAVFDRPAGDPGRMPYSVADRSLRSESRIIETLLSLFDLCESRFGVQEVLAILESPPVRERFELLDEEIGTIRRWVREARIRWGIDARHRSRLGLPEEPGNTWRAGIERLILGFAMEGEEDRTFRGVLPCDAIEGEEAGVLGRLTEFLETLVAETDLLSQPKPLSDWAVSLSRLLKSFFPPSGAVREIGTIRKLLKEIALAGETAGFSRPVDFRVIRNLLSTRLEKEGFGSGFMTGGVTFCAMLPMRSIPFQVVCCLGMNGDAYPRRERKPGFDLMARNPRPGDRSRREDDRYLFLEALLSARKIFYIGFVGRSQKDNSPIPPSVLVSELMDEIDRNYRMEGKEIRDRLTLRHPLQPFSPDCFGGEKDGLFSYSEENLETARRIASRRAPPDPFLGAELDMPEEAWRRIELAGLDRFLRNPAAFLLNRRLDLFLEERDRTIAETEPFRVDRRDRYRLDSRFLDRELAGDDPAELENAVRASGMLPHGAPGEAACERMRREAVRFAERTRTFLRGERREPVDIDLAAGRFRVVGRIESIYPDYLIRFRHAPVSVRDRLELWLRHVLLNCIEAGTHPRSSLLIGRDPEDRSDPGWAAWRFIPLDDAPQILEKIVSFYWEGLASPLPFFPRASWEFALQVLERKKPREEAIGRARNLWIGNDWAPGERNDPYFRKCFETEDPFGGRFEEISLALLGPIIRNQEKVGSVS